MILLVSCSIYRVTFLKLYPLLDIFIGFSTFGLYLTTSLGLIVFGEEENLEFPVSFLAMTSEHLLRVSPDFGVIPYESLSTLYPPRLRSSDLYFIGEGV